MSYPACRRILPILCVCAATLPALDVDQVRFTVSELPYPAPPPAMTIGTNDYFRVRSISRNGQWALLCYGSSEPYVYYRYDRSTNVCSWVGELTAPPRNNLSLETIDNNGVVVGTAHEDYAGDWTNNVPVYSVPRGDLTVLASSYGGSLNDIAGNGNIVGDFHNATETVGSFNTLRAGMWLSSSAPGPAEVLATSTTYLSSATRINTTSGTTYIAGLKYPLDFAGQGLLWRTSGGTGTERSWEPAQYTSLASTYNATQFEIRDVGDDGLVLVELGGRDTPDTPRRNYVIGGFSGTPTSLLIPCIAGDNATAECRMAKITGLAYLAVGTSLQVDGTGEVGGTQKTFIWQRPDSVLNSTLESRVIGNTCPTIAGNGAVISSQGEVIAVHESPAPGDRRWLLLTPVSLVSVAFGASSLTESSTPPSTTITVSRTGLPGCLNAAVAVTLDITGDAALGRLSLSGGTISGSTMTITIPAGQASAVATLTLTNDASIQATQTLTLEPVPPAGSSTGTAFAATGGAVSLSLINDDGAGSPTVTITRSVIGIHNITSPAETITVTFSEAVTGFADGELVLTGGGSLGTLSGSGAVYYATWTAPAAGEGGASLAVAAGAADGAGGSNLAGALSFSYDTVPPAAPTISSPADGATVAASFTVVCQASSDAASVLVNGRGATYVAPNWSILLTAANGPLPVLAVSFDAAGNISNPTQLNLTVDAIAPSLAVNAVTSPTAVANQHITGTTNDAAATITLREGGTVLGTTSGSSWQVDSGALSDGSHSLVVTATDPAGNITTSAAIPVVVDTTGPVVTLAAPSAALLRSGMQSEIEVSYADATTALHAIALQTSDVIVTRTAGTAAVRAGVLGRSPTSCVIIVDEASGDGTITVSLPAGTADDTLGNLSPAAGPSAVITIDNTAPAVVSVSTTATPLTTQAAIPVTVTFDGAVSGTPIITAGNASVGTPTSSDGIVWTVTLTATAPGTVTVTGITALDAAGNTLADATVRPITVYDEGFAVTVEQAAGQADPTSAMAIDFTVTSASAVDLTSFTVADLVVGGTATGTLVPAFVDLNSGTQITVRITGMVGSGTVTLALPADRIQTITGSRNRASTSVDASVTWLAPAGGDSGTTATTSDSSSGGGCGVGAVLGGLLVGLLSLLGLGRRRN